MKKANFKARILIAIIILFILFIFSFFLGRYSIAPEDLLQTFWYKIEVLLGMRKEMPDARLDALVFQVRMPRIVLACVVGCCLSAAGASYQGIFQNPMAAPDVLGASSGAGFGAALAILMGGKSIAITLSAFVFSLITVGLVIFISRYANGGKILGLVLSGMMITSLFSAGTSYIKLVADPNDQLPAITYWLMGSLQDSNQTEVLIALIPAIIGLLPMLLLRWRMNVLTMGDDEARSIGVNAGRVRLIVILSATLITAASVSVSGIIGWVGLVVPHLARKMVGNNYVYLMPMTMLSGAIFLLLVDNVSRNLLATEIPIGILTAIIGAPFFIFLMTRKGDFV
jgi:iron complex transport system permease protein